MKYIDSDGQILEVEYDSHGTERYYNSEKQNHRLDGPAVKLNDGGYFSYVWWKDGLLHRIGGPAVVDNFYSSYSYYINNKKVNAYYIYG